MVTKRMYLLKMTKKQQMTVVRSCFMEVVTLTVVVPNSFAYCTVDHTIFIMNVKMWFNNCNHIL